MTRIYKKHEKKGSFAKKKLKKDCFELIPIHYE